MNQFRTAFFGGYRKEQVDEYVNSMIAQLEQMKESFLTKEEEENRLREELAVMQKRMEGLENQQNTRIEAGEPIESQEDGAGEENKAPGRAGGKAEKSAG